MLDLAELNELQDELTMCVTHLAGVLSAVLRLSHLNYLDLK